MGEMTARQVIERERECVARQQCDRNCAQCDLVMEADDILAAYDHVLELLKVEETAGIAPQDFEDAGNLQHFNEWRKWSQLNKKNRLLELPCKVGDTVYRVWKVDGRKTEITEHKMENIVQIAQWLHLFGKTVFVLRADAEAYAKKEENQK